MTPSAVIDYIKLHSRKEWKQAFLTVLICGFIVHFKVFSGDFPNHDGLASMYFDQNMITSGRWFLSIACGITSYFTLPWLIGVCSLLFLAIGAVALVEFLEVRETVDVVLISGMLVVFPALASTYAYIFTADGYMMALCLGCLSVCLTKKWKRGYLPGGICLALSMGIYQAYLSFVMVLSIYGCVMILLEKKPNREKGKAICRYLYMGILGVTAYYGILMVLLKIQGKVLDTYQGINDMTSRGETLLFSKIVHMIQDCGAFTVGGNVLFGSFLSAAALVLLTGVFCISLIRLVWKREYWKKWYFYGISILVLFSLPLALNMILLISPHVTYHLLMRYQWVLLPILGYAFITKYNLGKSLGLLISWCSAAAMLVLILHYGVVDNIAYFNLEKKYEKTYAYCLRLADRMEQTPGYYPGIPVAMVGVQGSDAMPCTDITTSVTSNMIGMTGDYLVYTDANYQAFWKHYMGISVNLVPDEEMERIYHTKEYRELNSFPAPNSTKVVDGVLYIKTENQEKE